MKTSSFTMTALAAVIFAASAQAQVVFPKAVTDATGARATIAVGSAAGMPGDTVTFNSALTVVAVSTTLSAAITDTDTTIPLTSVAGFPSEQPSPPPPTPAPIGSVKIENEVITYTGISGNNLTGAVRGVGSKNCPGPTNCPAAHASGTAVNLQGVAGTQNDIGFDPKAQIIEDPDNPGSPLCVVNPAIHKTGSSFAFEPSGCTIGTTCTSIRALVLSTSNVTEIPTGSNLYTCSVKIDQSATIGQSFALPCTGPGASDPTGVALTTDCTNGTINVGSAPTATATAGAPTATPTPTTAGHTTTPTAVKSNTPTSRPTRTGGIRVPNDDDACAIVSPESSSAGWMLLLPAAMLLWVRRRSR